MLRDLKFESLDQMIDSVVPKSIRKTPDFNLASLTEVQALKKIDSYAELNKT